MSRRRRPTGETPASLCYGDGARGRGDRRRRPLMLASLFGDVVARASKMIVDRNDDAACHQEARAPNPPRQTAVPKAFDPTAHCTATRLCFSSTPLASNTSTTL